MTGRAGLEALELGGDPLVTARAVRRLRGLASAGAAGGGWDGVLAGGFDARPLFHLPPPGRLSGGDAGEWRAAYSYGAFYYRVGPGFLVVRDARDPVHGRRVTLDDPALVAGFRRCEDPVPLASLPPAERDAVYALADEGLVLLPGAGDHRVAVVLPYRMLTWPVPVHAV